MSNDSNGKKEMRTSTCFGCRRKILDQYILQVGPDMEWHASCLKCSECHQFLDENCTCFVREKKTYCKRDYLRNFGIKCEGCFQEILPTELVRKARNKVFHLKCFTCLICRKQLSTGEELYIVDGNKFICKLDFLNQQRHRNLHQTTPGLNGPSNPAHHHIHHSQTSSPMSRSSSSLSDSGDGICLEDTNNSIGGVGNNYGDVGDSMGDIGDSMGEIDHSLGEMGDSPGEIGDSSGEIGGSSGAPGSACGSIGEGAGGPGSANENGTKRRGPRTTIKAKQLETLKNAFAATPKPTRHIREQLASETGLNMRVIQVWFQNRRSKERRMKQLNTMAGRRHFFRSPRRAMRPLRPGLSPHDHHGLDDSPEMPGGPGSQFGYFPEPPTGDYPFASGGPDGPGGPFVPGYTDFGPGSGPDSYSPDSRPFFGYPGHIDGFNGPPPPPNHGPPPPGQPLGPNAMSL